MKKRALFFNEKALYLHVFLEDYESKRTTLSVNEKALYLRVFLEDYRAKEFF